MSERFISEIDSLYNFIVKFVDDVINSVTACFVRYFDFEGRSSRAEFWHWQLFRVLLFLSLTFLETVLFSEIEVDDLFWLKENGGDNPPYRKTTDTHAGNTKTRVLHNFDRNQKVFQRI